MRSGRWLLGLMGAGVAACAGIRWLRRRPELPSDPGAYTRAVSGSPSGGGLRFLFLGVSTMVLTDGETVLITDGFFSRPPLRRLLGKVAPDLESIESCLSRAGVSSAAAVLVAHSHYDHAFDSPEVARLTGARLVGSSSTLQIGRGYGLAEERMTEVTAGSPIRFGRFVITMIISEHSPKAHYPGSIDRPLRPPARISAYKMAECYSMLIDHVDTSGVARRILVHASAGYLPEMFAGVRADAAFLGIGTLGKQSPEFRERYWRETVLATGVKSVIPIHWDDFTMPLSKPLVPMPFVADDFDVSWQFLTDRGRRDGVVVRIPREWVWLDPLAVS